MLSFKQTQQLDEVFSFTRILGAMKMKISQAFRSLGFGKKVKLNLGSYIMSEEVDLKSRLGYLSEYATALELSKIITATGGRITTRSQTNTLQSLYNQKKQEVVKLGADANEVMRQESAGKVMADQIFKDIVMEVEDFPLLTFDIELTGDSGKGVTKADLILSVTKDSEKVVVDRIMASLKAYKSDAINLSNSTFISLIKTLFYDNTSALPTRSEEFLKKFVKDFGSAKEINELYRLQNIIGAEMKAGADKAAARKTAKGTHGDVIALIATIFKTHYPRHKKEINERVLKMLGFDGEDDFYAAIGETGKQKVLSSRNSPELQKMIANLSKGFVLTIERNGTTNNANMVFKSPNGKVVFNQLNITFADTGGKNPQGKTNAFMKFKQYMSK
jgi:hypothetical protein